MGELFSCVAVLFLVFGLSTLLRGGSGNSSNQCFGDGKNRYDFKDYVNRKVDEDLNNRNFK